jgi:hypothetical protein
VQQDDERELRAGEHTFQIVLGEILRERRKKLDLPEVQPSPQLLESPGAESQAPH